MMPPLHHHNLPDEALIIGNTAAIRPTVLPELQLRLVTIEQAWWTADPNDLDCSAIKPHPGLLAEGPGTTSNHGAGGLMPGEAAHFQAHRLVKAGSAEATMAFARSILSRLGGGHLAR
ncbi:MAG: hypothetical protein NTZ90_16045 [Proteobacteria bacterium]|nr:hypothetical protein [Pseudomonadota bacterium]